MGLKPCVRGPFHISVNTRWFPISSNRLTWTCGVFRLCHDPSRGSLVTQPPPLRLWRREALDVTLTIARSPRHSFTTPGGSQNDSAIYETAEKLISASLPRSTGTIPTTQSLSRLCTPVQTSPWQSLIYLLQHTCLCMLSSGRYLNINICTSIYSYRYLQSIFSHLSLHINICTSISSHRYEQQRPAKPSGREMSVSWT